MATTFIAKHGLKSNIANLTLSEGELALAYNDDKTEAEIYVGSKDNKPIPTSTDTVKNQVFVQCDGDHDELKLQAAIDKAPANSIIYPVGECVITNDNTVRALGGLSSSYSVVIRLKTGMVLDGTYCESITFKNTNPAEKQYIFQLNRSEIRNIEFWEDTETVTETSINPSVVYAADGSVIRSCNFYDIFDTNKSSMAVFDCRQITFVFNTIDGFKFGTGSLTTGGGFRATTDSVIFGNTFKNFVQSSSNNGQIINCSNVIFQNNIIDTVSDARILIGGEILGNVFERLSNTNLQIAGTSIGNYFTMNTIVNRTFLDVSNLTIFNGNKMIRTSVTGTRQLMECNGKAIVSDNYISISKVPADYSGLTFICAYDKALLMDNYIYVPASTVDANEIFYSESGAVVKNNVTNAKTLGTFSDDCTVEGNVTGGDA